MGRGGDGAQTQISIRVCLLWLSNSVFLELQEKCMFTCGYTIYNVIICTLYVEAQYMYVYKCIEFGIH
jgi:hypothetical protein